VLFGSFWLGLYPGPQAGSATGLCQAPLSVAREVRPVNDPFLAFPLNPGARELI
jgi:hypothetical protein